MILKLEEDDNRPNDALTMIPSTILVEEDDEDVLINALLMSESNDRSQFYLNVINANIAEPTKDISYKTFYPDINTIDNFSFPYKDVPADDIKSPGYGLNYK